MATQAAPPLPCPSCAEPARFRPFDLAVRDRGHHERLFFGVPAAACAGCGRLVIDAHIARVLEFHPADVSMAVLSDRVLLERRRAQPV
jgi:hypothetical protein